MANFYSPETIDKLLQTYKTSRKQANDFKAPTYQQFAPKELDTDIEPQPLYQQLQDSIIQRSQAATQVALTKAQNAQNYKLMLDAQRQAKQAKNSFGGMNGGNYGSNNNSGLPPATGGYGNNWGPDGIPEVIDIDRLNPNGPLTTFNWRGHNLTLNRQVAPIFRAFLDALWRTGYRPKVIGSHADRNIAGTNTPSLHSYGFAIDIDPAQNPVTWNGIPITTLPPNVGALAARYGLAWGGAWNGNKTDSMHFSVPYGGTK